MPLTLSLQFPAGRYVAASWGNRDEVEWPPHPARLCLALIDALHKSGNVLTHREALLWLFGQSSPIIVIPAAQLADVQVLDGIFVPQNPAAAEGIKHTRKQRSFPTVFLDPDAPTVFFHWQEAEPTSASRDALSALLAALPRFGHSSSLVIGTVSEESPPAGDGWRTIQPLGPNTPHTPEFRLRVSWDGLLKSAEDSFDADGRSKEMDQLIALATRAATPDKPLKPVASPRSRHDPRHRWQGYSEESQIPLSNTPWDHRLLMLAQIGGDRLGLSSIWQLTEVFHKTLLDRWDRNPLAGPIPSWLSGHQSAESGEKTAPANECHLAVFPLPFVGSDHATGHLLGLAIGLPRPEVIGIDPATFRIQWRQALSALLGDAGELELSPPDKTWLVRLAPDESPDPKQALRPARWTQPATTWSTVTPIILDRHPRPHFSKDPEAWRESCMAIIAKACVRLGLPEPVRIDVSPHSPLPGVPPAFAFPAPAGRSGRPARFHVHASLQFAAPIQGPLLIGAGRYRGYGLCLPLD